jgi:hypothetical protein
MTFQALGLTHTCHDHWASGRDGWRDRLFSDFDPHDPLPEAEIRDIHHSEQEDIGLLETLVEQFEKACASWDGDFFKFLDDYWTVEVEKALADEARQERGGLKALKNSGWRWCMRSETETKSQIKRKARGLTEA